MRALAPVMVPLSTSTRRYGRNRADTGRKWGGGGGQPFEKLLHQEVLNMSKGTCPECGLRESRTGKEKRCAACYMKALRKKGRCASEGCTKTAVGHGYCRPHEAQDFERWDSAHSRKMWERLADMLEYRPETGCWVWIGQTMDDGRPRIHLSRTRSQSPWLAYRFTYVWAYGGHTHKQVLDHMCKNIKCCNPRHVYPMTQTQNQANERRRGTDLAAWWCPQDKDGNWIEPPPVTLKLGIMCSLVGLNPKRFTPAHIVDDEPDPFERFETERLVKGS